MRLGRESNPRSPLPRKAALPPSSLRRLHWARLLHQVREIRRGRVERGHELLLSLPAVIQPLPVLDPLEVVQPERRPLLPLGLEAVGGEAGDDVAAGVERLGDLLRGDDRRDLGTRGGRPGVHHAGLLVRADVDERRALRVTLGEDIVRRVAEGLVEPRHELRIVHLPRPLGLDRGKHRLLEAREIRARGEDEGTRVLVRLPRGPRLGLGEERIAQAGHRGDNLQAVVAHT